MMSGLPDIPAAARAGQSPGASRRSRWSINSTGSILSINSVGSILSIGSAGSILFDRIGPVGGFGGQLPRLGLGALERLGGLGDVVPLHGLGHGRPWPQEVGPWSLTGVIDVPVGHPQLVGPPNHPRLRNM